MLLNFAACGRTSPACLKSSDEFNNFPLAQREVHTAVQGPHLSLQDAPMTPATTGKDFGDTLALAPLRERLGELASRNILVGTSS
jgi:hypothetical protein